MSTLNNSELIVEAANPSSIKNITDPFDTGDKYSIGRVFGEKTGKKAESILEMSEVVVSFNIGNIPGRMFRAYFYGVHEGNAEILEKLSSIKFSETSKEVVNLILKK